VIAPPVIELTRFDSAMGLADRDRGKKTVIDSVRIGGVNVGFRMIRRGTVVEAEERFNFSARVSTCRANGTKEAATSVVVVAQKARPTEAVAMKRTCLRTDAKKPTSLEVRTRVSTEAQTFALWDGLSRIVTITLSLVDKFELNV
jgi:hypothetical protein